MKIYVCLVCLFFLIPSVSEAAVTINEVAWMGDAESANNEWIELHNSGSTVDLSDWTLSDGGNLTITLNGYIGSGQYAVLERSSDAAAPGTAFLIYTGALKNTGATLTLFRVDNSIEDQVAGGTDWSVIGGDNASKKTAQYTTNGWITADPTPGSGYGGEVTKPEVQETAEVAEDDTTPSVGGSSVAVPVRYKEPQILTLPEVTLELEINGPDIVYVNQPITFSVIPSGVGDTIRNSLSYEWNFGDLHTARTKEPAHTFSYPGTYMVHVFGEYARQHAVATKELTVLPVSVSLTRNSQQDIQINNDSPYSIDLSDYRLRAGEYIDVPKNSLLLPNQTLTVPNEFIDYEFGQMVGLYDAVGNLVSSIMPKVSAVDQVVPEERTDVVSSYPRVEPAPVATFQFAQDVEEDIYRQGVSISTSSATKKERSESNIDWTLVGLIIILLVGSGIVLLKPIPNKDSLDKHE